MLTQTALKKLEHKLKFQSHALFLEYGGVNPSDITFRKMRSSRIQTNETKKRIGDSWNAVVKKAEAGGSKAFDSPKARYEGISEGNPGKYTVLWSGTSYKVHGALKDDPKFANPSYQARPLTINSIIKTDDHTIPIAHKNGDTTDQGDIMSLTAIGFQEIVEDKGYKRVETIDEAVTRRMLDEYNLPEGVYNPEEMRTLALIDNSVENHDLTFGTYTPLHIESSELLKCSTQLGEKGKYKEIEFVSTSRKSLEDKLYDFAKAPKTVSGHMNGDIAALYGMKYGGYENLVENTAKKLC